MFIEIRAAWIICVCFILAFASCDSCQTNKFAKKNVIENEVALKQLNIKITPSNIFDLYDKFTLESDIILTMNNNGIIKINREKIIINGENDKLHFKKHIDGHHFIDIFKDKDAYFIKTRFGEWRDGRDNKLMYEQLLMEGLNPSDFILSQFSLYSGLKQGASTDETYELYVSNEQVIAKDAPFLLSIKKLNAAFEDIEITEKSGKITMNKTKNIAIGASFYITLSSVIDQKMSISLNVDMKLQQAMLQAPLNRPIVQANAPFLAPVNIKTRFNELMDSK